MKLDVEGLRQNDPDAIRALHEACVRYARMGARRMMMGDFADDIAQDMFLKMVSANFLDEYDPEQDVDGWMVAYAKRAAMGMARTLRWHREVQSDRLEMEPAADAGLEEQLDEAALERRANAAKRALREQASASSPHPKARRQEQKDRIERWQRTMRARPVVSEIVTKLARLGLTQQQAAKLLGMPTHHLRAVLYGRVSGKPHVILKQLAEFEAKENASGGIVESATVPITQQMARWRDRLRLGQAPGWHLTLAEALGIHRSTVYRWNTGKSQPAPWLVRLLDTCVEAQVRHEADRNVRQPPSRSRSATPTRAPAHARVRGSVLPAMAMEA